MTSTSTQTTTTAWIVVDGREVPIRVSEEAVAEAVAEAGPPQRTGLMAAEWFAEGLTAKFGPGAPGGRDGEPYAWPFTSWYEVLPGTRFAKIARGDYVCPSNTDGDETVRWTEGGRSVHAFVELATGHVYKAEGWKKPAKGVRYTSVEAALEAADPHGGYLYQR